MSYRVELRGLALTKMKDFPTEALTALVARAADLVREPWDARVARPGTADFRQTTFGDGMGILWFHLDATAELIEIYDLIWAG
ncbi:hypothetical protein N5079_11275 [Planotetraspora sp. A-T 1434]|uniref:hypothetical protein n=1 Tax=Planotetraspora sp. A-T 1434 TaxID=2979219 RepID=UPI0021C1FE37|nr:hypothetical protein [Planotetraspora sp. A-T 1434]MCT9930799.1 hypothetical protein [Planotetraspora sp. A-T 1434]